MTRVLMITGDRNVYVEGTEARARFELQRKAVDMLLPLYWGRGDLLPSLPEGHFDVVTVQDPFWRGLFAWYVSRKKKARFNVQVHTDLDVQTVFRRTFANIILRQADSVRVVSRRIKIQVERMGIRTPIHVLPVFIDKERFVNLQRRPLRTTKTILWIGRFEKEKNPLEALTILKGVRGEGIDARLVMLGKGSLENKLREKAKGLPVEFFGWQDPAPSYRVADVVVSTSLHESFGVSIVEALSVGIPTVAPDVGVAREAGAIVVSRDKLISAVVEVLRTDVRGTLKLTLPTREEWIAYWRKTL